MGTATLRTSTPPLPTIDPVDTVVAYSTVSRFRLCNLDNMKLEIQCYFSSPTNILYFNTVLLAVFYFYFYFYLPLYVFRLSSYRRLFHFLYYVRLRYTCPMLSKSKLRSNRPQITYRLPNLNWEEEHCLSVSLLSILTLYKALQVRSIERRYGSILWPSHGGTVFHNVRDLCSIFKITVPVTQHTHRQSLSLLIVGLFSTGQLPSDLSADRGMVAPFMYYRGDLHHGHTPYSVLSLPSSLPSSHSSLSALCHGLFVSP